MLRLARRAGVLFLAYTALILAVVIAGFLGAAVGIWASVLWGAAVLAGLALYVRQRRQRSGSAKQAGFEKSRP
jgi:Flp pilus assembly protein TadB